MQIYGLKTCDTCRKARKWVEAEGIEHQWFDIRADGVPLAIMQQAMKSLGHKQLLNRRSTSWRKLGDADKANIDNDKAVELIMANPALMKRPLFVSDKGFVAGFDKQGVIDLA